MHFCPNGVPGAMDEVVAVARLLDMVADATIDLPAGQPLTRCRGIEHRLDAHIASVTDDLKDLPLFVRRGLADEGGPGNIVVHRAGRIFLRPNVQQDEIPLAYRSGAFGTRFIVRVAAVAIYGHDWRGVGDEVLAAESFHEPLLDGVLGRTAMARTLADLLKGRGRDAVDRIARREVRLHLFVGKGRFELRDQVG